MKPKILYVIFLILGLLVGFIVGGVVVSRQYDRMLFSFFKVKENEPLIEKDTLKSINEKKASVKVEVKSENEIVTNNKLTNEPNIDTTHQDSVLQNAVSQSDEEIVIKKDILVKTIKLNIFNSISAEKQRKGNYLDSLLIDDHYSNKTLEIMNVEFWQSPVNYKGYKMSRQKLVLFGLDPLENLKLKLIDGFMYLKYGNKYYKFGYTDEFLPLQIVLRENATIKK